MKKIFLTFSVVFAFLLSGCSSYTRSTNPGELKLVQFAEVSEMIENDETFMMMFTQTNCKYCQKFVEEVLSDYITNHEITVYDIVFDKQDDMDPVLAFVEEHPNPKEFLREGMSETAAYTPTFYFIEKGEVKSIHVGAMDTETFDGYIKKYQLDAVKE